MANEIQAQFTSGKTIYAVILNAVGQVWNGAAFVTPAAANWTQYVVAMPEQSGSGLYEGNFPSVIAGVYNVIGYQQLGGTAASTDSNIGAGRIDWSGSSEIANISPDLIGSVSDAAPASGSFKGNSGLSATDGFYVNAYLAFTGGALQGLARKITGYTGATRLFTFGTAFPATPANNDSFSILGGTV